MKHVLWSPDLTSSFTDRKSHVYGVFDEVLSDLVDKEKLLPGDVPVDALSLLAVVLTLAIIHAETK